MCEDKPEGYALLDLRAGQCKWPITPHTSRYHRFCGAPTKPADIYCEKHRAIAGTAVRGFAQPQREKKPARGV